MEIVLDIQEAGSTRSWKFSGSVFHIGRDPSCDLVLASDGVSAVHAAVALTAENCTLEDCDSTNGTFVNGRRVNGPLCLEKGDVVGIGLHGPTLSVKDVELSPIAQPVVQFEQFQSGGGPPPQNFQRSSEAHGNSTREPSPTPDMPTAQSDGETQRQIFPIFSGLIVIVVCVFAFWIFANRTGRITDEGTPAIDGAQTLARSSEIAQASAETIASSSRVPSTPPPSSPPDSERVDAGTAATVSFDGVVWVGLQVSDYIYPVCTGWAASSHAIVTSGEIVHQLQSKLGKDDQIVIFDPRSPTPVVPVASMHIHQEFNADDPTSTSSVNNNIAVLKLATAVTASFPVATESDLAHVLDDEVTLAYFHIPEKPTPYDKLHVPTLVTESIASLETEAIGAGRLYPLFRWNGYSGIGVEGAPLLNSAGKVVGSASVGSHGRNRAIPVDRLRQLLQ